MLTLPAIIDPVTKRPPAERFKDAEDVRRICEDMRSNDSKRSGNRAKIQGLIDGNRPYSAGALYNQGQGWRANVNYREAEGIVQAQRTPYYDLVTEVNPCIQLTIDYGADHKRHEWERIIAEEFHRTLFNWDSWDWHIQLRQSEELVHGWGCHLTMDAYDWKVSTKCMRDILFPDNTTSDLEDMEFFCVRDTIKAHKLYNAIQNKAGATLAGWNIEEVEAAIIEAATTKAGRGNRRTDAEDIQQSLKNGDLGFGWNGAESVTLNHFFVREISTRKHPGGISHYIIVENSSAARGFLFKRRNRFRDFDEILHFFPFDIGSDGTIHSIRGLGARIFPFCELFNRLKNHMVDNVLINSGILLAQPGNGVDMSRLQLTSLGPLKILPPGLNPAQWRPVDLAQGPLPLTRELQATMQENTKVYRQTMADSQVERTATEAAINNADTAKLAKSAHNMEYRALGKMYRELLRRMLNPNVKTIHRGGKEAVAMQERCYRRGVPKAAFAHIIEVTANRSLGAGSASQRIQLTTALLNLVYPMVGPLEQNNILRDYVAALAGQNAVARYVPTIGSDSIPTDDDSVAVLENDALINGGEALVAPNQNHMRHAARHIQKAFELVPAIHNGQADPAMVLAAWDAIGAHAAVHVAYMSKDPTQKREFEAAKAKLEELSKLSDQLRQNLEEQAQAAEAQSVIDETANAGGGEQPVSFGNPEMDLMYQKLRAELLIRNKEADAEIQNRRLLANTKAQNETKKTNASIALKAQAQRANQQQNNGSRPYTRPGSGGTPKS